MTIGAERREHDDPTDNVLRWLPDGETKFLSGVPGSRTIVRDAMPEDAAGVAAIGMAAVPQTYEALIDDAAALEAIVAQSYALDELRACIARCGAQDGDHFLVAERDHSVVGFLHYDRAGSKPELHRLYVEPDLKRQGIGSALVNELHRRLGPRESYILMVVAANRPAVSFYECHGLVETAQVDGLNYMHEHMGIEFRPDSVPVPALILRYTGT